MKCDFRCKKDNSAFIINGSFKTQRSHHHQEEEEREVAIRWDRGRRKERKERDTK